jgi:hypothetical protein
MTLPAARARIDPETVAEIVRLDIHGLSHTAIARQVGVNRRTVGRALDRVKSAAGAMRPLEQELNAALNQYRELQRVAWQGIDKGMATTGKPPALLLQEVRLSQARIDDLLGLLEALASEAPEARHRLAERFREIAGQG